MQAFTLPPAKGITFLEGRSTITESWKKLILKLQETSKLKKRGGGHVPSAQLFRRSVDLSVNV
jgi:hypothetical protein